MADKAPLWDESVREHGLLPTPFDEAANWAFADYAFAPTWDIMLDSTKARRFGFQAFVDTEAMFLRIFDTGRRRAPSGSSGRAASGGPARRRRGSRPRRASS